MSDEEIIDWHKEAEGIIYDIQPHVNILEVSKISKNLMPDEAEIFLNLETKEGKRYTVRLSSEGFAIVGNEFDCKAEEDMEDLISYETPYALLQTISKEFTNSFGNSLIAKLSKLQEQQGS